jgi:hypothetical protein
MTVAKLRGARERAEWMGVLTSVRLLSAYRGLAFRRPSAARSSSLTNGPGKPIELQPANEAMLNDSETEGGVNDRVEALRSFQCIERKHCN